MFRRPAAEEDDDGGFSAKYTGPEKRAEKSRKELLGVTGTRVPKAKARQLAAQQAAQEQAALDQEEADAKKLRDARVTEDAYEYDPYADNPLRRAEQQELEQLAVKRSKEVTSDLRNVLKITEDTKGIGAQTLVTLKQQGEQIVRTHEKIVTLDQEMVKGEKLLNKLGPMFTMPWKTKKTKKISGPTYQPDSLEARGDPSARKELTNGGHAQKERTGARDKHGNFLDDVEDEKEEQDDILDAVSANVEQLKQMAMDMGRETERQNDALDKLQPDVEELNSRQKQANRRGRQILGYRK